MAYTRLHKAECSNIVRTMVMDVLFPPVCLGCGKVGTYICICCKNRLSYLVKQRCLYCERNSYLGITHNACRKTGGVDGVLSILQYDSHFKKILKQIKYRYVHDAFTDLFQSLCPENLSPLRQFYHLEPRCLLQPVPLHAGKLARRGFNQAARIAGFFSVIMQYDVIDAAVRIKETMAQAQLSKKAARKENVRAAFALKQSACGPLQGSTVVIVDDVVTTGNTVCSLAQLIKRHGADKVYVFSLARG